MVNSGNTTGKGRIGVLDDIAAARPTGECPIQHADWLLAGTTMVLSAEITFFPIQGKQYHLYERGRLYLAITPPEESHILGEYIGACVQRSDCLWEVDLAQLPSPHLLVNGGILRGSPYNHGFNYYNNILAHHVAKKRPALPPGRLMQYLPENRLEAKRLEGKRVLQLEPGYEIIMQEENEP